MLLGGQTASVLTEQSHKCRGDRQGGNTAGFPFLALCIKKFKIILLDRTIGALFNDDINREIP